MTQHTAKHPASKIQIAESAWGGFVPFSPVVPPR